MKRKLSPEVIAEIKAIAARGYDRKAIARLFDVHLSTVYVALHASTSDAPENQPACGKSSKPR